MTADTSAILLGLILIAIVWSQVNTVLKYRRMTPEQRAQERTYRRLAANAASVRAQWGGNNPALVCPHCQTKGRVRVRVVRRKRGISGAKATGALLTGGASLLATGLSRKEALTQAHCEACGSTWDF